MTTDIQLKESFDNQATADGLLQRIQTETSANEDNLQDLSCVKYCSCNKAHASSLWAATCKWILVTVMTMLLFR